MQTNGFLLNERLIDELDSAGLSRINMSIEALEPDLARKIAGIDSYNIDRVLRMLNILPGILILTFLSLLYGFRELMIIDPKLIEFALKIGAGKKGPAFGIQKFLNIRMEGSRMLKWWPGRNSIHSLRNGKGNTRQSWSLPRRTLEVMTVGRFPGCFEDMRK